MKKAISVLALLCLLALPALAKPYHYSLLEDLQKTGDVGQVTDDSDMQMTFEINQPFWLVRWMCKRMFELSRLGLERYDGNDDEQAYIATRWTVKSVDGAANFVSGIDQVRTMLTARVVNRGPRKTSVVLTSRLQIQDGNYGHGWVDRSEREMRNVLREYGTTLALACRYPLTVINQASVRDDYQNGRRLGKGGYEMPPEDSDYAREKVDKDYAAALKEAKEKEAAPTPEPSSVADELRKLKALMDEGVLTPEEFEAQKQKLLNQ